MRKGFIYLALVATLSCFAWGQGYAAVPSAVAHWSFDGNGLDSSGSDNDATPHGEISYLPGIHGPAAQFHGNRDYFQVANSPAMQLRGTRQFSVVVYVRPTTLSQQSILMHGLGSSTRASWFLGIQGSEPDAMLHPGSFVFGVRPGNGIAYAGVTGKAVVGQWTCLAATYDGVVLRLYVDGTLQSSVAAPLPYDSEEDLYIGGDPRLYGDFGCSWFVGLVDEVSIFDQALTADEVRSVMQRPVEAPLARDPDPAQGAGDVPQDTPLSWTPGEFAATHDVYFGTSFDAVSGAGRANPMGVLVSQNQPNAVFDPGRLQYGQAYYWRIDEVNGPSDYTIHKGVVWNFTVEPYSYPIPGAGITATASSAQANMGPENTINGSGLDAGDRHATDPTTMWLSMGKRPNWIQYQFDGSYKLEKLMVWNSNQSSEQRDRGMPISFSAKDVTVQYSVDGTVWTSLANVPQFAKASGEGGYTANTTLDFGGVMARYVKLTLDSTWSEMPASPLVGLSEVRFYYIPVQARSPSPAAGATDQSLTTTLNWRPGRDAGSHTVFFGTDSDAVANGRAACQIAVGHTFDPGTLTFGTTYYWKVDEVGATGTFPGEVWSFTTREFAVVDDFESYNDTDPLLSDAWIDGVTDGMSGSTVGHADAPFAELSIVHRGRQSMPLAYDNSEPPFYSETTRDLDAAQDWTVNGATHVNLWFRGYPALTNAGVEDDSTRYNAPAGLYAVVQDSAGRGKLMAHPAPGATAAGAWTHWKIPLSDLAAGGVDTTHVQRITIGVGDRNSPQAGGAGLLYIDDIGYGHPASLSAQAHTPQPADSAAGQSLMTTLNWQPGREGGAHRVFFGTDPIAVADGTAPAETVADPVLDPGTLDFGTTYYWRVDQVASPVTYSGEVWSFTTQEFAVVDDFEAYDEGENRIYHTWIDGTVDGASGSLVGYLDPPYAEQKIVHAGKQSMPLAYDNSKSPFYSEATRDLGAEQDWTGHGATHLSLWFRGYSAPGSLPSSPGGVQMPTNAPASLYLIVTDKAGQSRTVVHPDPSATVTPDWTEWRIPPSDLTAVDVTAVWQITLGVGDKARPEAGGTGLLYIDDIGYGHPVK